MALCLWCGNPFDPTDTRGYRKRVYCDTCRDKAKRAVQNAASKRYQARKRGEYVPVRLQRAYGDKARLNFPDETTV